MPPKFVEVKLDDWLAVTKDAARYRHLRTIQQWTYSSPPMRAVSFSWFNRMGDKLDELLDREIADVKSHQ